MPKIEINLEIDYTKIEINACNQTLMLVISKFDF